MEIICIFIRIWAYMIVIEIIKKIFFHQTPVGRESSIGAVNVLFTCSICFSEQNVQNMVKFSCTHINCGDCVSKYFTTLINDGKINSFKCPEFECESQASPDIVQQLLSGDVYQRYNQLLLASITECLDDVVECPNVNCRTLVFKSCSNLKSLSCPSCKFIFCTDCKNKFHGQSPCVKSIKTQVIEQYKEATRSLFGFWKIFKLHKKCVKKNNGTLMEEYCHV